MSCTISAYVQCLTKSSQHLINIFDLMVRSLPANTKQKPALRSEISTLRASFPYLVSLITIVPSGHMSVVINFSQHGVSWCIYECIYMTKKHRMVSDKYQDLNKIQTKSGNLTPGGCFRCTSCKCEKYVCIILLTTSDLTTELWDLKWMVVIFSRELIVPSRGSVYLSEQAAG